VSEETILFKWKQDKSFCKVVFVNGEKIHMLIHKKEGINMEFLGYSEDTEYNIKVTKARTLWDYLQEQGFRNVELNEQHK
jgi:hypothetical protein